MLLFISSESRFRCLVESLKCVKCENAYYDMFPANNFNSLFSIINLLLYSILFPAPWCVFVSKFPLFLFSLSCETRKKQLPKLSIFFSLHSAFSMVLIGVGIVLYTHPTQQRKSIHDVFRKCYNETLDQSWHRLN